MSVSRLAVGHALVDDLGSSLARTWDRFEALLPGVSYSNDPLAASNFLASASSVSVLRGHYLTARRLAEQALSLCTELRIDFALGACHIYKASAEIGLRRFAHARRSLQLFARRGTWRDDPYFHLEALAVKARLLASQGALLEALATRCEVPPEIKASRPLGVFLGTLSMILQQRATPAEARLLSERAHEQPSGVERLLCSELSDAIANAVDGVGDFDGQIIEVAGHCHEADYMDGLVLAIRVFPKALEALAKRTRRAFSICACRTRQQS